MRSWIIVLSLLWSLNGFAAGYIVLFKQAEVSISSLEHGAYQSMLQGANQKSLAQLNQWLGSRGVAPKVVDLWLVRGAALPLEEAVAQRLAKEPWVEGVYPDRVRQFVSPTTDLVVGPSLSALEGTAEPWGLKRIGLPRVKKEFPTLDGTGVRVGILDTGIQSRHPEFAGQVTGFRDFVTHLAGAYDDHGHGTHVAGTIAGKAVGIAPKATLICGKIFTAGGSGTDSAILQGMQWIFNPDGMPGSQRYPHIVSNSWGGELPGNGPFDILEFAPYRLAIQAWIHGGIIPVFAAGNSGKSPNGFPGGLPEPLAVGALDASDLMADFSSRGPNLWRIGEIVVSLLKPDISAPGVKVTSAFPGNKYATWDGTSMATPHVAGAIALALQANRKLKFADVKALLLQSSEKKIDIAYGYGILDAYALVKAALAR